MDVPDRAVERRQRLRADQVLGHRVGDRTESSERAPHELADRPRRDALGRSVDRRDPPRVHQVPIVAPEQLDLLVRELEPASVQLRDARDRDLVPLLVHRARPGLVEKRQVEVARAVVQRDRDHRLPAPGLPLGDPLHACDHGRVGADPELPDPRHLRAVDVAARVVVQEVADGPDPLVGQDLGRRRALRPQADPARGELAIDRADRALERQASGARLLGPDVLHAVGSTMRSMTLRRLGLAFACWALLAAACGSNAPSTPARSPPTRPLCPSSRSRTTGTRSASCGARWWSTCGRRGAVPAGRRRRSSRGEPDLRRPGPVHRRGHPRRADRRGLHARIRVDLSERVRPERGDPRRPGAPRPAL